MYKIYIDLVIQQDKTTFPLKQDRVYPSIKFKGETDFQGFESNNGELFFRQNFRKGTKNKPQNTFLTFSYPIKFIGYNMIYNLKNKFHQ